MDIIDFQLDGEHIELIQLLKVAGVAQTGGHAKILVDNGIIRRNGEVEERKRAKIKSGEKIEVEGEITILVH